MTIANYFTLIRLLIAPLFLIVYLQHEILGISSIYLPFVLLILLTISELSDAFDGYLARKFHQVTDFGKILDPMVDSVARTCVFLTFTKPPINLPIFLLFIFIYRDFIMSTLRTVCALKGFALAASNTGKIKAVIQAFSAFAILMLMIPHSFGLLSTEWLQTISFWIVVIAAIYTVYSAIEYLFINKSYIVKLCHVQTTSSEVKNS